MSEQITVRGFVASGVREDHTHGGDAVASFRLGATERRLNRQTNEWEDGDTNWYSVSCFRSLAHNVAFSVQKGERVIVTGRLKLRNWSMPDGRAGTTADIDAETVGHDLLLGVTKYKRSAGASAESSAAAVAGDDALKREHPGLDPETGELPEDEDDGAAREGEFVADGEDSRSDAEASAAGAASNEERDGQTREELAA